MLRAHEVTIRVYTCVDDTDVADRYARDYFESSASKLEQLGCPMYTVIDVTTDAAEPDDVPEPERRLFPVGSGRSIRDMLDSPTETP